jgi:transposase
MEFFMKKLNMTIVNTHAAGIDIGSRSHLVAVGQQVNDVREFGVYTQDYESLILWLKERKVKTIAMESTGNYWQTLFTALQTAGFEVLLVNGQHVKNVKGKKTDVQDCQWIQKLHSLGLLSGSFLPGDQVSKFRAYYRHRCSLIEESAKMINKMQKALRLMNIRLDVAIKDIMGKTGRAIVEAILSGEKNGESLAALADYRIKKNKQELARSLQGNWQEELLYELKDCYELYQILQEKVTQCDKMIESLLKQASTNKALQDKEKLKKKKVNKNSPRFDLSTLSYQYAGVDLFAIDAMSHATVLALIAEVGQDINKFPSAKHFVSWLRLAPNNKISGGKTISSRTPKAKNNLTQALRQAANAIDNLKQGYLVRFFRRIAYRKGRGAAITATARKMAVIIWNMMTKKITYQPMNEMDYSEKIKQIEMRKIKQKINQFGFTLADLCY